MGVCVEMQVLWCIPSGMVLREQWYALGANEQGLRAAGIDRHTMGLHELARIRGLGDRKSTRLNSSHRL